MNVFDIVPDIFKYAGLVILILFIYMFVLACIGKVISMTEGGENNNENIEVINNIIKSQLDINKPITIVIDNGQIIIQQ